VLTLAVLLHEGASLGLPGSMQIRSRKSHVKYVHIASMFPRWFRRFGVKGRYQNACRYQLRYQLSDDSKRVTGKGSEVATSDPVF